MNIFYNFFWFCAGADKAILEQCPSSEKNKHAGIGATIVITSILAVISGSYAVRTVVDSMNIAILIGLFWGAVIFNIDRLLVATMKKYENQKLKEVLFSLPRILLAVVIALIISKPIEVKILEKQIDKQIQFDSALSRKKMMDVNRYASGLDELQSSKKEAAERILSLQADKNGLYNTSEYTTYNNNFIKCDEEQKNIQNKINDLVNLRNSLMTQRRYIKSVKVYKVGEGSKTYTNLNQIPKDKIGLPVFETVREELNSSGKNRRTELSSKINELVALKTGCLDEKQIRDNYISDNLKVIGEEEKIAKEARKTASIRENSEKERLIEEDSTNNFVIQRAKDDFFGKLMALKNATSRPTIQDSVFISQMQSDTSSPEKKLAGVNLLTEQERVMISGISWAIMLLFFIIELCPIFVKILTPKGSYDRILETQEIKIKQDQEIIQQEALLSSQNKLKILKEKNDLLKETELDNNHDLLMQLSGAQKDIAKEVVNKWKEKQLRRLETNPDEYLKEVID